LKPFTGYKNDNKMAQLRTITYEGASKLVKKVKDGLMKEVLCIIAVDEGCPVCFQMTNKILPQVKEMFNGDIDFVELNVDNEDLIFPPVNTPVCFFYIRGNKTFPIVKTGLAPIESVIQDVEEIVTFNRKNNGQYNSGII
jgi:hypothetical protein|tara:strand:- start:1935 stop:2354 length:420 start_codon:yes stop_codon:yes gene_type:complete